MGPVSDCRFLMSKCGWFSELILAVSALKSKNSTPSGNWEHKTGANQSLSYLHKLGEIIYTFGSEREKNNGEGEHDGWIGTQRSGDTRRGF
jgi:hypothetical protein